MHVSVTHEARSLLSIFENFEPCSRVRTYAHLQRAWSNSLFAITRWAGPLTRSPYQWCTNPIYVVRWGKYCRIFKAIGNPMPRLSVLLARKADLTYIREAIGNYSPPERFPTRAANNWMITINFARGRGSRDMHHWFGCNTTSWFHPPYWTEMSVGTIYWNYSAKYCWPINQFNFRIAG